MYSLSAAVLSGRRTQRLHQLATAAAAGRCCDNLVYSSSSSSSSSSSFRSHRLSSLHYAAILPSRDRRHRDDVTTQPGMTNTYHLEYMEAGHEL